jgi:hypothetical protein
MWINPSQKECAHDADRLSTQVATVQQEETIVRVKHEDVRFVACGVPLMWGKLAFKQKLHHLARIPGTGSADTNKRENEII